MEGINDAHAIVGEYMDVVGFSHGFISQGGQFRTADFPGSDDTFLFHMNSSGQIVGDFSDLAGDHSFLAVPLNDDVAETAPTVSLRRATAAPKCTLENLRGHHKNMKNPCLCD